VTEDQNEQIFENRFWLRIMLEHLYIIMNALNYREVDEHRAAQSMVRGYNELLARSWDALSDEQLKKLNQDAYVITQEIRKYKLHLLRRQLAGSIAMDQTSGLTSRLVNEAEWYLDILSMYMQNKKFVLQPVRLHLLWLIDAAGHAEIISNGLNYSSTDLKEKTLFYQKEFVSLYVRASELRGFLRIGEDNFPAFEQFNEDVNSRLTDFTEFFVELNAKIISDKVPATISPVALDHMYREECYYLTELSKVSKIHAPICDPTVQAFELPK
jgi:hypothetical protein